MRSQDFYNQEDYWIKKLQGRKAKGKTGEWEFYGPCDPSGAWLWENKKTNKMIAATPFWGGDSIPIEFADQEYGGEHYKTIDKPTSYSDYLKKMKKELGEL